MMRPGEPPTEDAVQALFGRLFYNEDTYDLSRVGRMKFNARVGRDTPEGPMTLGNEDILDVVKIPSSCAMAAAKRRHGTWEGAWLRRQGRKTSSPALRI